MNAINSISSIGRVAGVAGCMVERVRQAADELHIEPAARIDGVLYFADDDADLIARHLHQCREDTQ